MTTIRNAFCLHAHAKDLAFLNPVRNKMVKLLGPRLTLLELTDPPSHANALVTLKRAPEGLVLVFAHGSADYLRGGEYRSRTTGETTEVEKFMTRADLSAFTGKVIFCLSCDSNGLALPSLKAGALAFVGFNEVPFNRFNESGEPIGSHALVKHCQFLIAEAMKAALERFIKGSATLDETVEFLRLWINQEAVTYVRKNKSVKERREVAALFLKVKKGVCYHGQRGVRFA